MPNQTTPQINVFGAKLARPVERALTSAGMTRLEQLPMLSQSDLNSMHGIGPNAVNALRVALAAKGLTLAPDSKNTRAKSAKKNRN